MTLRIQLSRASLVLNSGILPMNPHWSAGCLMASHVSIRSSSPAVLFCSIFFQMAAVWLANWWATRLRPSSSRRFWASTGRAIIRERTHFTRSRSQMFALRQLRVVPSLRRRTYCLNSTWVNCMERPSSSCTAQTRSDSPGAPTKAASSLVPGMALARASMRVLRVFFDSGSWFRFGGGRRLIAKPNWPASAAGPVLF
ncbi:hypothetical protein D3C77_384220 [compost metagenome]